MAPMILEARQFFFDRMLPVRLFYTRCSEVADWHSHEFTEIAIVLAGRAVYETEFSAAEIAAIPLLQQIAPAPPSSSLIFLSRAVIVGLPIRV